MNRSAEKLPEKKSNLSGQKILNKNKVADISSISNERLETLKSREDIVSHINLYEVIEKSENEYLKTDKKKENNVENDSPLFTTKRCAIIGIHQKLGEAHDDMEYISESTSQRLERNIDSISNKYEEEEESQYIENEDELEIDDDDKYVSPSKKTSQLQFKTIMLSSEQEICYSCGFKIFKDIKEWFKLNTPKIV